MDASKEYEIKRSPRIQRLKDDLFKALPEIEADRALLLTESYRQTENQPIIVRRYKAFEHILDHLPITIREHELIVGSNTKTPRGAQIFPEFSFDWIESEFDTFEKRLADPFFISEETKEKLSEVFTYWAGKTTSELATSYMDASTKLAMTHHIFTPGNYYYNGVGHVTVDYELILQEGLEAIIEKAKEALNNYPKSKGDYNKRKIFLESVIRSQEAAIRYAHRYGELAEEASQNCACDIRKKELQEIAKHCKHVPGKGARNFKEACQSFWFIQMLLQVESNGHSISPGRMDQYLYPFYQSSLEKNEITQEAAQEYLDCIWIKLNDLNKVRDAGSAEGFAGYGLFQNLIVGGQNESGEDVTNPLSYMCIEASLHVMLPQPSLSVRVWNGTPQALLIKAVTLTRTGIGLPAYYNDEVIIPSLLNRGLTIEEARTYNIIGCVEPQKSAKTDGWHDAAFFNMCKPLEMVFSNGFVKDICVGPQTGDLSSLNTYDKVFKAYEDQMNYFIERMVNAINAIDVAHSERCPLPFLSGMVDDCITKGLSVQEGGAKYNFTGPQGFGIANLADSFFAIKKLVFEEQKLTLQGLSEAMNNNFGESIDEKTVAMIVAKSIEKIMEEKGSVTESEVNHVTRILQENIHQHQNRHDQRIKEQIDALPKFGNDIDEVDQIARAVAYTYTKPIEKYENPRGGVYQAGLYPVSANVPLGAQTGATPDGRLKGTPIADGVSPSAGKDIAGPTAAANSVAKLDHFIASNGTLFNQKFHPMTLSGRKGLEIFSDYIRAFFDKKGSHIQFNVVSKETLIDAQQHPEKYKSLVVRVAGYSALFTALSKSLQDDIINRTEQSGF